MCGDCIPPGQWRTASHTGASHLPWKRGLSLQRGDHLLLLQVHGLLQVLNLLANRCLADRTNAWTDTDHTCYTVYTAGLCLWQFSLCRNILENSRISDHFCNRLPKVVLTTVWCPHYSLVSSLQSGVLTTVWCPHYSLVSGVLCFKEPECLTFPFPYVSVFIEIFHSCSFLVPERSPLLLIQTSKGQVKAAWIPLGTHGNFWPFNGIL